MAICTKDRRPDFQIFYYIVCVLQIYFFQQYLIAANMLIHKELSGLQRIIIYTLCATQIIMHYHVFELGSI